MQLQNLECRLSEQLCRSAENLVEPQNQGRRQLEVLVQPQSLKRSHERDEGWNKDMELLPAAYSWLFEHSAAQRATRAHLLVNCSGGWLAS